MPGFRLLFVMVVACVGFVVMMGTVAGVGYGIIELADIPGHDDGMRFAIFGGVAIFFLFFLRFVSTLVGGFARNLESPNQADVDDVKLMQEIYHGLERMDKRVESLETILIDRTRTERGAHL